MENVHFIILFSILCVDGGLQFALDCSSAHELTVYFLINLEVNSKDSELEYITVIM